MGFEIKELALPRFLATPFRWTPWCAAVTAVLFEVGKFLIGLYLGRSSMASTLGAAGALLALLFWVYYTAQIFLFGAAFTKHEHQTADDNRDQRQRPGQWAGEGSGQVRASAFPR